MPAEDTLFLLDDEKWKASKDNLPLQLEQDPNWEELDGGRSHEARLSFSAEDAGEWALEIIRECDRRGGYDEVLSFFVS